MAISNGKTVSSLYSNGPLTISVCVLLFTANLTDSLFCVRFSFTCNVPKVHFFSCDRCFSFIYL